VSILELLSPRNIRAVIEETKLKPSVKKLKGKVVAVEKTAEIEHREGEKWTKCIFTLRLTRFSSKLPTEPIPQSLKETQIKLVRYCLYDWHLKLGTEKTLEPDETAAVLAGKPTKTVFW
jgi:hypothetical protein